MIQKIEEMIEEEVAIRVTEKERELEDAWSGLADAYVDQEEKYEWLELPDYKLMQHQKDAINKAIQLILSNELEVEKI